MSDETGAKPSIGSCSWTFWKKRGLWCYLSGELEELLKISFFWV